MDGYHLNFHLVPFIASEEELAFPLSHRGCLEVHLEMRGILAKKCLFLQREKKEKLDYDLRSKYQSCRDLIFFMINMTFTVQSIVLPYRI